MEWNCSWYKNGLQNILKPFPALEPSNKGCAMLVAKFLDTYFEGRSQKYPRWVIVDDPFQTGLFHQNRDPVSFHKHVCMLKLDLEYHFTF